MSKPYIHAKSSARKFGGLPSDYEEIHTFLDSSKAAFPSNLHRTLTHNSWFIFQILERIKFHNSAPCTPDNRFPIIINSDGKEVSVRDIGEQHILEDFSNKFIPSVTDYLNNMEFAPWMQNGHGYPPSFQKIYEGKKLKGDEPAKVAYEVRPSVNNMVYDGSGVIFDKIINPHNGEDISNMLLDGTGGGLKTTFPEFPGI